MYSFLRPFTDKDFHIGKESVSEHWIDFRDIYQRLDYGIEVLILSRVSGSEIKTFLTEIMWNRLNPMGQKQHLHIEELSFEWSEN